MIVENELKGEGWAVHSEDEEYTCSSEKKQATRG
jgi:hypothetical protein